MKYQLLNTINENYSAIEQVLTNRGITFEEIPQYLNTTDAVINDYNLLGPELLNQAYLILARTIKNNEDCLIVVDSDCDGFTSAAVMINYLYDWQPEWVSNHVTYILHEGKQHGLKDIVYLESNGNPIVPSVQLIIMPDAGSNDYDEHAILENLGINLIILDHHEAEKVSEKAIVINNQLSSYPNKEFSGVGIVWQFCRYLDEIAGNDFADKYLDMVALGLDADMMSLKSIETKHLINKGLESQNVTNPFFYGLKEKNSFSLKGELTPIGVAFYIAPYVNAMTRSGTMPEKRLLFQSMLKHEAFKIVPSTKRGKKIGDTERIVDQALRAVTNVKSRQTKAQVTGMEIFESMIEDQNLLDHKVLLFKVKPGKVGKSIAGLVANKFMSKYQRNTMILTETTENGIVSWRGSARGYSKSEIASFKDMCEETGLVEFAQGHAAAFGVEILDSNMDAFLAATDKILENDSGEASYFVDYEFDSHSVKNEAILDIARLNNLWGQDMPEALVAIKGLKITNGMLTLMSPDKNPTLKIALPGGTSILKFKSSQEEYDKLFSLDGYVEINLVGTCNQNEWMGNISPQIFIKDYEVTGSSQYYF